MKQTALALTVALTLLASEVAEFQVFKMVEGNPYFYGGAVSPRLGTVPLKISVSSPINNTIYNKNLLIVVFNVSTPETQNDSVSYLLDVRYKADWLRDDELVFVQDRYNPQFPSFTECSRLSWVPDGNHSIVIIADGGGGYVENMTWYAFDMVSIEVTNFTVDATPPEVSILSVENKTYNTNNIPLDFRVSEPTSVSYSLDNRANTTIVGNTTLTGLSDGAHSLTLYANDTAGNSGISETVHFEIQAPPLISILTPTNKTYITSNNPLTITVSEPVSWMRYSLDGRANVTISGNTTLLWLPSGLHSLTIYACDVTGNIGVSETIHFSIATITMEWSTITLVPIALVGAGLLLFHFRKRNRGRNS